MTELQLKIRITKAKNALTNCNCTLAEKLILKRAVKTQEEELRQFRLNYFDRVQS